VIDEVVVKCGVKIVFPWSAFWNDWTM
jgi:hypothetical protein